MKFVLFSLLFLRAVVFVGVFLCDSLRIIIIITGLNINWLLLVVVVSANRR
jgi:hypothetical protein